MAKGRMRTASRDAGAGIDKQIQVGRDQRNGARTPAFHHMSSDTSSRTCLGSLCLPIGRKELANLQIPVTLVRRVGGVPCCRAVILDLL